MTDKEQNKICVDDGAWLKLFAVLAGDDEENNSSKSVLITDLKKSVRHKRNAELVEEYGMSKAQLRRWWGPSGSVDLSLCLELCWI